MLILLIGALDWLTGVEISFSIFYLIPIALISLYNEINRPAIIINSFIAATTWFIADYGDNISYSNFLIPYWNAFMRLVIFVIVGMLLYSLKNKQKGLRQTNHKLEKLNTQINAQKK